MTAIRVLLLVGALALAACASMLCTFSHDPQCGCRPPCIEHLFRCECPPPPPSIYPCK